MYSINDICSNTDEVIDDSNIFQFASHVITPNIEPFFSMVLSLSTHSPYDSLLCMDCDDNADSTLLVLQDSGNARALKYVERQKASAFCAGMDIWRIKL